MDFYGDNIDEDLLVELPCEFCQDLFPLVLLVEHQTGCRPDLVRVIEPTVEEIENAFLNVEPEDNNIADNLINRNLIELAKTPPEPKHDNLQKEKTPIKIKEAKKSTSKNFEDYEILDDDLLQGNESTFTYGSTSNREKRVEEEKPSFRIPPIPILNNSEARYPIHNDLPDSDNEEGESLEEFWRKAEIKLAERLRALEKKKPDRKI